MKYEYINHGYKYMTSNFQEYFKYVKEYQVPYTDVNTYCI